MPNAPAGVVRALSRFSRTKSERSKRANRVHSRRVGRARGLGTRIAVLMHLAPRPAAHQRPLSVRRSVAVRLSSEHMLPILAAVVVLGASIISFQPATASAATGSVDGPGSAPRIAIGGADQLDPQEVAVQLGSRTKTTQVGSDAAPASTYADDGTLYKGVAVDTSVADGRALLKSYTVRSGDTLTGIASHNGVSMMTIWWANKLTAKDQLHVGQKLTIPPVDGLVITVKQGDTLDAIATKYRIDGSDVLAINQLEDPNLIIGQTLILPDAVGPSIPTVKTTPKPRTNSGGSSSCSTCNVGTYGGGAFKWPVIGGNNYVSQSFHYGHYGVDIAATYGSTVVAAAKGTVTFAGWKNNGGGYQVWISHGSGLFTTYNHMSAVSVSAGRSVGRGQQVGRIGQSGNATGPHLHFEVWKGPVWNGGYRVNPLRYF